jgi:hypothetical protein
MANLIFSSQLLADILNSNLNIIRNSRYSRTIALDGAVFIVKHIQEIPTLYFALSHRSSTNQNLVFRTDTGSYSENPFIFNLISNEIGTINPPSEIEVTVEFDLVYISIEQLCYVAGIVQNTNGRFIVDTSAYGYYLSNELRGLSMNFQMTRAFILIDTTVTGNSTDPNNLTRYRTLKFNPFPEPIITIRGDEPALAYEMGIPCPPKWKPGTNRLTVGKYKGINPKYKPEDSGK